MIVHLHRTPTNKLRGSGRQGGQNNHWPAPPPPHHGSRGQAAAAPSRPPPKEQPGSHPQLPSRGGSWSSGGRGAPADGVKLFGRGAETVCYTRERGGLYWQVNIRPAAAGSIAVPCIDTVQPSCMQLGCLHHAVHQSATHSACLFPVSSPTTEPERKNYTAGDTPTWSAVQRCIPARPLCLCGQPQRHSVANQIRLCRGPCTACTARGSSRAWSRGGGGDIRGGGSV
jgi:hypothetical protein